MLEAHLAAHWWWANHISAWTVAGEDAQVSFGSCFGLLYGPLIQATLVVMLQHAYGGLECLSLRAVIGKLSWGSFWAFQWWKQLALLRRQATDRWEPSHVIRTLARSIASLSARLRSIVVSPEHPLSRPCHLKPDREVRWAWNCDKKHVVRRLPGVPIFRRPVETSSAMHHERKWRRSQRRALTAASAGGGSVSVPMGWLHVQIATVQWAAAPATRPWHGTAGFRRSGWCRAVAHQTRCVKWKRKEQC